MVSGYLFGIFKLFLRNYNVATMNQLIQTDHLLLS